MRFCLLFSLVFLHVVSSDSGSDSPDTDIVSQYIHVPTSCETENCVAGGCLFENCAAPLSCKGGLCYFKKCKEAACEGGACIFDNTAEASCSGGGCQFVNVATTLDDGYCKGGGCTLEGDSHPSSLSGSLAQ
ncbi:Secreted RxLR effector protein RXLR-C08 [Phytophthora oleae]|uniref:Secreted RxLR effector protein RXLR-C08 n=1 Tax=Phytophthora oleae TaxID=2107226 RepID=A0ABD3F1X4_9STRA